MKESSQEQKANPLINNVYQPGIGELENSKIIRSIWKNTFDKILEIKISNKRELKAMKEKIMLEERKKIDQNYNRKYNDEFTKKKIEVSTAKNKANLDKMNIKNELVQKTVDETLEKIKAFAKIENNSYKKLIKELILECMVKLLEKECYIKARKGDINYIQTILKECENEYAKIMKKETPRANLEGMKVGESIVIDLKKPGAAPEEAVKVPTYLLRKDDKYQTWLMLWPETMRMNPGREEKRGEYVTGTGGIGGWTHSEMRKFAVGVYEALPECILTRVVPCQNQQIEYDPAGYPYIGESIDRVWLYEMDKIVPRAGENRAWLWDTLKDGAALYWWLRSAYSSTYFRSVSSVGSSSSSYATNAVGVALGFITEI